MSIFVPVLFFGELLHWIGFLLDDLFFRGYRKVAIKDPVFIVGIPRSGTTLLHRVMAQDSERFTSFKLWELLLAPSITERKLWTLVGSIDRACGGAGRSLIAAIDRRIFGRLSEIHKMTLFDYDEDELVLGPIFSTVYLLFPFPFYEETWRLVRFDEGIPPAEQDWIMRFYKACVQRHLYFHGAEKQFLSKNPSFSAKVDAIRAHFSGARMICNMRSPYDTVPSLLSALYVAWDMFDNDPQGDIFRDRVLELADYWYRHPMNCAREWAQDRFVFLSYDDLRRDLKSAVADVYTKLAIEPGPQFAERLSAEHEKAKSYKSNHRYSLEQYGLSASDVLDKFGYVFERFGFAAEHTADDE
ncbi:MAG: sulfotransferase [Candidatus Hydrogenedentes bacterium]|nr:sulfotransferase [Candidatus Hydrogenedentota bacterium]